MRVRDTVTEKERERKGGGEEENGGRGVERSEAARLADVTSHRDNEYTCTSVLLPFIHRKKTNRRGKSKRERGTKGEA